MEIICMIVCDRCGNHPISDPDNIDIFIIGGGLVGASRCPKCSSPITKWVSRELALDIAKKGAKIFSFSQCEAISLEAFEALT